jgi:6-phosphogluconolactonase
MTSPRITTLVAAAFVSLAASMTATGATFVYVSNAEDGEITTYRLDPATGALQPGARVAAGKLVMPMTVSPDRRFLHAALRTKPFTVMTYAIEPGTGALKPVSSAPLHESFPYIALDRSGRYLFGASYGAHLISVNAVGNDGRVSPEPLQVIPIGRNAHSIQVDGTNRFVYVPTLGSDQIFQFQFDEKSGRLTSNTPPILQMKPMTGPRHFVISRDNRHLYALSELLGTVTTFSIDGRTGLLTEVSSVSGVPPEAQLGPGAPRLPVGAPGAPPPRNVDKDIWAADIHATPNGKFIYISERTGSTLNAFSVDEQSGKLTYVGNAATEKQPRGFAIDPSGKYLVATGEMSPTISVYAIDPGNGALRPIGKYPTGKGANWVEIVSVD